MSTRRRLILEAIKTRLEAIDGSGDYETDMGGRVYLGYAPSLGPDDPATAIAIAISDDRISFSGEKKSIDLPVEIQAIARADLDEPWLAVEGLIGDIKRAMELADRTLGGLVKSEIRPGTTRTLIRREGSDGVGAGVLYVVPYQESWGNPDA